MSRIAMVLVSACALCLGFLAGKSNRQSENGSSSISSPGEAGKSSTPTQAPSFRLEEVIGPARESIRLSENDLFSLHTKLAAASDSEVESFARTILANLPLQRFATDSEEIVFRTWVERDPDAALKAAVLEPHRWARQSIVELVLNDAADDQTLDRIITYLKGIPKSAVGGNDYIWDTALERAAKKHGYQETFSAVTETGQEFLVARMFNTWLKSLITRKQPLDILAEVAAKQPLMRRRTLLKKIAAQWVSQDNESAIAWATAQGDHRVARIFQQAESDSFDAQALSQAAASIPADPDQRQAYFDGLAGKRREQTLRSAITKVSINPAEAAQLLATVSPGKLRDELASEFGFTFRNSGANVDSLLEAIAQFSEPADRESVLIAAAGHHSLTFGACR